MKYPSLVLSSAFLAAGLPSHAAIVANFTDGTGTSLPDQYAGAAGSGWLGAWGTTANPAAPTIAIANASPVNGGGNYLTVASSNNNDNAFGRRFDGSATGVNITLPVTITFDIRIDTLTGWNSSTDYITLHASNAAAGTNYNVSANSSFIIRGYGASPLTGKNANEWLFYNGAATGAGGLDVTRFQNSGMTIATGTTYSFTVTNDPATKTYSVSIFDGTTTVSSSNLGWRASTASNGIAFNQRVNLGTDVIGYSLDNISIVPEPGSITLFGLAGLALLRRRRVG